MAETHSVYLRTFAAGLRETEGNMGVLPGDGGGRSVLKEPAASVLWFPVREEPGQRVSNDHPEICQSLSDNLRVDPWLPGPGKGFPVALFQCWL